MTIEPTSQEIANTPLFDPTPGTIHTLDLINLVKDGILAKHRISDYVMGILWKAKDLGIIKGWEAALFQLPFTWRGSIGFRKTKVKPYGRPFLGPDGRVLRIGLRRLGGDVLNDDNDNGYMKGFPDTSPCGLRLKHQSTFDSVASLC